MMDQDQLRAELAEARKEITNLRAENAVLKQENANLEQEAHHDPLTGLLNRAGMRRAWDQSHSLWAVDLLKVRGVIMCDSDHFKSVNDTLDHRHGDIVLCKLAEKLAASSGKNPVVRTGGDEFIVIVTNGDPVEIAHRIRESTDHTMAIKGHEVYVTFSVGVAVNPPIDMRLVDLLDYADHETIRAKRAGRNRVSIIHLDEVDAD